MPAGEMRTGRLTAYVARRVVFSALASLALVCLMIVGHAHAQAQPPACPPPAPTQGAPAPQTALGAAEPTPEQIVACVSAQPITGATFLDWLTVARKDDGPASKHSPSKDSQLVSEVMGFLISSDWVIGEAQERHIVISETKVRHTYDHIRHQQFPRNREFKAFLKSSGETVADLLFRVRLNLLSAKIQRQVIAGHHGAHSQKQALSRFVREFKTRWQAQTYCEPAYAVSDCGHVQAPL